MDALSDGVIDRFISRLVEVCGSEGDGVFPPASDTDIEATERDLGFRLVPALDDLYRAANGGDGFLGVVNGAEDDLGQTAVSLYRAFSQPEEDGDAPEPWSWVEGVVPVYYWGSNTYSCVDRTGRMIGRDGAAWVEDGRTLESWLTAWIDGKVTQPVRA